MFTVRPTTDLGHYYFYYLTCRHQLWHFTTSSRAHFQYYGQSPTLAAIIRHPSIAVRSSGRRNIYSRSVWNGSTASLGVTIGSKLPLIEKVNNVCKAALYHARALHHVRKYVSEDVTKSIATSLVDARLHYCNTVFYGTSCKNIDKLQRVQNTLARVVKERTKYDHIQPLLSELRWLPIAARIRHKIAVLTFKTFFKQGELSGLNGLNLHTNKGTYIQFTLA